MSVTPSAPVHEHSHERSSRTQPVAAMVYADNAYPAAAFEALVRRCLGHGLSLAGVLQHQVYAAPDRRCDVVLEDLTTGHRTAIFEDRGSGAAGCRLDESALAEATALIEGNLDHMPDLLVLNKFGKAECGGGGLVDLIANAMDRGIPVIIGVPRSNLDAWRKFVGDLAIELSDDTSEIERWLETLH